MDARSEQIGKTNFSDFDAYLQHGASVMAAAASRAPPSLVLEDENKREWGLQIKIDPY